MHIVIKIKDLIFISTTNKKMKFKNYQETIEVPEGIEAKLDNTVLIVKGPKGELKRDFVDPRMKFSIQGNKITIDLPILTKREKKQLGTFVAHIKNMFVGAKEGFVYKLKICSGHFPMNVSVKNSEFIIKNFIGEKIPRVLKLNPDVKVGVDGEIITVEANNIELAGQTAGSIEQLSKRPGFDRRIFQQGIFITDKPRKGQI